ncbi:hypothetical protein [Lactobacillus delbrueckii]|uniref:hypothetical protein n=1 Tax=Lactobacillus delbrueckii TaxID=1584 RepID=UPI000731E572|nr:hypothetical protein [Lactobacillus delbrueckii]ALT47058.1 hypothetical protein AT236_00643 [Lactobacillus delbrueckii subsp. bulgaricus]MCD5462893.1 hypothetical protein [Lactobacillus delbrueckii subsp. bulgaricus]MCD5473411.1 hypothetical protein [Lactobacillus delbrueckii subsp. bulgaricus]
MIDVLTSYNANQVYQDQARDDLGVTVNFSLSADQYRDMPLPFIIAASVYQEKRVVDMQYIYVNQAYAEIMGQSREKLLGNRMSNFVKHKLAFWIKVILALVTAKSVKAPSIQGRATGMNTLRPSLQCRRPGL